MCCCKRLTLLFFFVCLTSCSTQSAPADPYSELRGAAGLDPLSGITIGRDLALKSEWVRGCETVVGNLYSDAMAWGAGTDIGFVAGGNIRDDQTAGSSSAEVTVLKEGKISEEELLASAPWNATIYSVRLTMFRLKQGLEASVTLLGDSIYIDEDGVANVKGSHEDEHGAQHGDCYYESETGNGRFLQISANLAVVFDTSNQTQVVAGSATDETLEVTTFGRRVTAMTVNGELVYENSDGAPGSGWQETSENSCSQHGFDFTDSTACSFTTIAIPDFQWAGNDDHPTFNPDLKEIDNDGTSVIVSSNNGIDAEIISDYINNLNKFNVGVIPVIEDRQTFVGE